MARRRADAPARAGAPGAEPSARAPGRVRHHRRGGSHRAAPARRRSLPGAGPARAGAGPGAPRLIGRDAELSESGRLLAKAATGIGQVVLLSGEAGIGKTTLIDTVTATSGSAARILIGRCHASERILAFGPWVA